MDSARTNEQKERGCFQIFTKDSINLRLHRAVRKIPPYHYNVPYLYLPLTVMYLPTYLPYTSAYFLEKSTKAPTYLPYLIASIYLGNWAHTHTQTSQSINQSILSVAITDRRGEFNFFFQLRYYKPPYHHPSAY